MSHEANAAAMIQVSTAPSRALYDEVTASAAFERERLLPAFARLAGGPAAAGERPVRHRAFHLVAGQ